MLAILTLFHYLILMSDLTIKGRKHKNITQNFQNIYVKLSNLLEGILKAMKNVKSFSKVTKVSMRWVRIGNLLFFTLER